MLTTENIISQLQQHKEQLQTAGVQSLSLFGSVQRGEANASSDIDLLVEFSRPVGLFEFVHLKQELEHILQRPVDLVTRDALRDSMKPTILKEAVDVTPSLEDAH
ncbi:MAG: nucleotidyltransferase family protein [Anaerolineales bacterium]